MVDFGRNLWSDHGVCNASRRPSTRKDDAASYRGLLSNRARPAKSLNMRARRPFQELCEFPKDTGQLRIELPQSAEPIRCERLIFAPRFVAALIDRRARL